MSTLSSIKKIKSFEIQVYQYNGVFEEPRLSDIVRKPVKVKKLYSKRTDAQNFIFVACTLSGENTILVVKFKKNGYDRTYCKSLRKWDADAYIDK